MRKSIIVAAGLPPEIADKIDKIIRDEWKAAAIDAFEDAFMPVAAVKNILRPSEGAYYYIDLDNVVGGWDDSMYLRNMALLYNHCRFVQKIVNDAENYRMSPLIEPLWGQKKAIIGRKYFDHMRLKGN